MLIWLLLLNTVISSNIGLSYFDRRTQWKRNLCFGSVQKQRACIHTAAFAHWGQCLNSVQSTERDTVDLYNCILWPQKGILILLLQDIKCFHSLHKIALLELWFWAFFHPLKERTLQPSAVHPQPHRNQRPRHWGSS